MMNNEYDPDCMFIPSNILNAFKNIRIHITENK